MSRQIKFRVWVVPSEDWASPFDKEEPYMVTQGEPDVETLQSFMFHYSDEKNLMQFTGLKDKNGKEIYEGDILSVKPMGANYPINYVVVFNDKLSFMMRFIDRYVNGESSFYDEHLTSDNKAIFEIIGNIYENPELIK